ncbi:MAG: hypothetical protein AB7O31_15780 [Burkholderiales bacterium]
MPVPEGIGKPSIPAKAVEPESAGPSVALRAGFLIGTWDVRQECDSIDDQVRWSFVQGSYFQTDGPAPDGELVNVVTESGNTLVVRHAYGAKEWTRYRVHADKRMQEWDTFDGKNFLTRDGKRLDGTPGRTWLRCFAMDAAATAPQVEKKSAPTSPKVASKERAATKPAAKKPPPATAAPAPASPSRVPAAASPSVAPAPAAAPADPCAAFTALRREQCSACRTQGSIARAICEERIRVRYCSAGRWGKDPACPQEATMPSGPQY